MKTEIFRIDSADDGRIAEVSDILRGGGLAAIPTETVYGLAGNALRGETAMKIFKAKGRPSDNPLIVHISSFEQWAPLVSELPEKAVRLAKAFWPGPLTIILPKSEIVPDEVSGKLPTVAVRMPSNEIARAIIEKAGIPLAAPSANLSGKPSPTSAKHVIDDLDGKIDAIVDSGYCSVGVESTVITLATNPPRLLRPGGVTPEMLESVLGEIEIDDAVFNKLAEGEAAASPGMKYKHYSPDARVTLLKGELDSFIRYAEKNKTDKTVVLCFDGEEESFSVKALTYGKEDDPESQAKHIFDALRKVDEMEADTVFVRFPKCQGMGLAVFNRLIRAAGFNVVDLQAEEKFKVIGLTGKTGAGKSTVSKHLKEKGCFIIDGDKIARDILMPGEPAVKELSDFFGEDIVLPDGNIDRKKVAERAFSSKKNTDALNRITHPHITNQFIADIAKAKKEGCHAAVIDAAALLESDCKNLCDRIVVVHAPEEIRLQRILARDGISREDALRRIKAQRSDDYYFSQADLVIDNFEPYALTEQIGKIEKLLSESL